MSEEQLIPIYIMGKQYMVPPSLTIQKAMEYAGYKLLRGCGCRAGFCGACGTVYRIAGDYRLKIGLACATMVQPNMYLTQIPFFPAERKSYDITQLTATAEALFSLYPEVLRCLQCGTCTKSCPQDIDVRAYMAAAMRGDIAAVADRSFDCIMCGLCAARCPAEEVQYNIGILCRRLYGRYIAPRAQHLAQRVQEIEAGKYDQEIAQLKAMTKEELAPRYNSRDIEPD
jgi:succinate dehydrogenase/fumarate reductase-like Fe-S protein